MKTTSLFSILSTLCLLFTTLSSAWPGPEILGDKVEALVRRQEQKPSSTDDTASAALITDAPNSSTDNSSPSSTRGNSNSGTGSATISGSGSGGSGNATATTTKSSKTTPIDPRLPPGGVQLITPAAIDGPQYYKVGDFVTFQWNYTSLSVTPSAIDVLVSCASNSGTYTIAANMSVEETGAVTWDLGAMEASATLPFPVASYTLMIHDAAKDVTDIPSAGFLGAYNQYVFGIYTGQPYVALNEFKCATCNNGALSLHERQALGVLLSTSLITVLSFTWFANGFGAFS